MLSHPSTSTLHASLHRADSRYACCALFSCFLIGFPPWSTSKNTTDVSKASKSNQKPCVSLHSCSWVRASRAWLTSQSHVGELESGEPVCLLSSLRELCLSLAITVCHATECRGHKLLSHAFFHPGHHGTMLPHILSTSKGKHDILLSSHSTKKAPLYPRDFYSSSAYRSTAPSP